MEQLKRYKLTEEDFERFRKLIDQASGMFFDRSKQDVLQLGLSDRAEAVGATTLSDYYDLLTADPERENEVRQLLAHLSVQETQFFRNLPQFDALRKFIIPEITRRKAGEHRTMRFWCAGCSTGQEPYSVAMSVMDVLPDPGSWNIEVLGTDLNEQALEVARRGWYPEKKLTGIDRSHLERYFRPQDGGYVISEPVRRAVKFARHNLVSDNLPISVFGTCDAVFCRNVIIYFSHETAKYVIEHFFDILNPGGYLFLGHSETLWKMSAKYSLVEMGDAFIYRKPLPMAIEGRRFIPERRMRHSGLPAGIGSERRAITDRRTVRHPVHFDLAIWGRSHQDTEAAVDATGEITKAKAHLDLGEFDLAISSLMEAIKSDGVSGEAYFLLGLAFEKKKDLTQAEDAFRKSVYCEPDLSLAHFHLANVLEQAGKLKNAIREYRSAASGFNDRPPSDWEEELEVFDTSSLVNMCEWKIENLGGLES
ncbi:MAG: CheR family methyltransferase [Thermoleophilia bacterium]